MNSRTIRHAGWLLGAAVTCTGAMAEETTLTDAFIGSGDLLFGARFEVMGIAVRE